MVHTFKNRDNVIKSSTKKVFSFFILLSIIFLFLLDFLVTNYSRFRIGNNCMAPSLEKNDIVIVKKIKNPKEFKFIRGMLIVFKFSSNNKKYRCLRLIGFPGEEVEIKDGKLYINGEKLTEPNFFSNLDYIPEGLLENKIKIPEGHVFLLGDNSPSSLDSRQIGPIPIINIVGIVVSVKKNYYE